MSAVPSFLQKVEKGETLSPVVKCIGSFLHFAAIITVLAVSILNLTGTLNETVTGLAFLGMGALRVAWQCYRVYKAKENDSPWKKVLLLITITTLPLFVGGVLGIAGIFPHAQLGWFFLGAVLVEATLRCTLWPSMEKDGK